MAKNIQIVLTDEQLKSLQAIAQAQVDALDCKSRIYLDDQTQHALLKTFAEICKKLIEEGSEPSAGGEAVDAYTKSEADGKFALKTEALTKTTADGYYLGKTAKASSATTADSATKATQDSDGNAINTTYAKKTELSSYVTLTKLTEELAKYQPIEAA